MGSAGFPYETTRRLSPSPLMCELEQRRAGTRIGSAHLTLKVHGLHLQITRVRSPRLLFSRSLSSSAILDFSLLISPPLPPFRPKGQEATEVVSQAGTTLRTPGARLGEAPQADGRSTLSPAARRARSVLAAPQHPYLAQLWLGAGLRWAARVCAAEARSPPSESGTSSAARGRDNASGARAGRHVGSCRRLTSASRLGRLRSEPLPRGLLNLASLQARAEPAPAERPRSVTSVVLFASQHPRDKLV